ncbi:Gamma-aminobutyric acid receptor-associated protein-like 3 [Aphelenchoides fujianensis]|nr:Gamma-aminobutyric acid receptor-associated protein-like 3 [Aphelenchoides fujianensis]
MSAQIVAPADGHLARKAQELRRSHPDRCAVVVEKAANEKLLPDLRKNKFLVPFDQEFVKFSQVIQKRLNLHEEPNDRLHDGRAPRAVRLRADGSPARASINNPTGTS